MLKSTVCTLAVFALVACGGGGGSNTGDTSGTSDYAAFLDPSSMEAAALSTVYLDGSDANTNSDNTGGDGSISVNGLAGQFNNDRDSITFTTDGGFADILPAQTEYVALFNARPNTVDPFLGIIGVQTEIDDLPSGAASYAGTNSARFIIFDADEGATFEVIGDVVVEVEFGDDGGVDLTFDNLDGTKRIGTAAQPDVTNLGTIEIDDADLLDGVFTGGTAEFTGSGDIIARLSGSETVTTNGTFFGPNGGEVGGVVIIDDSGDALLIEGGFTAN